MAKTICQTVQITTNETLRHKIYPWLEMKEDDINSLYWSITIKQRDIWEDERRNTRLYYPIYPTLYTPEAARTALHSERGGHKIAGACVSVGGVGGGVVVGGWVFSGIEPIPVNHRDVYGCSQSPCWPAAYPGLFLRLACPQPSPSLHNSVSCPTLLTTFLRSSSFFFAPSSPPEQIPASHSISEPLKDEAGRWWQ